MYANIPKRMKNNEARSPHLKQVIYLMMEMCKDKALYMCSLIDHPSELNI